jgi:hypothetical protein
MLSMPLIFQFLLLIGLRVIIALPVEPRARWIFRAAEPANRGAAIAGAADMMLVLVVVPTAVFALIQGLVFWSVSAALSHAVFCLVVGWVLTQILLVRTDKIPFACTYYPGKSRIFTLWPLYIIAFFLYALLFAEIDRALTTRPKPLLFFCIVATAAGAALVYRRQRMLAALGEIRFEEEDPDLMFQGFNLSEAMAAAPRPVPLDNPVAVTRIGDR